MTEQKPILRKRRDNIEDFPLFISGRQYHSQSIQKLLPFAKYTNTFLSGITYGSEEESRDAAINNIILQEIKELRRESKDGFESLEEANIENIKLHQELKESTQAISNLLIARKNTKRIYYLGLFTGITSGIGGGIFNNFIYIIVGAGITLTAITGLWEAKQNEW